jgi:hypothetical protein
MLLLKLLHVKRRKSDQLRLVFLQPLLPRTVHLWEHNPIQKMALHLPILLMLLSLLPQRRLLLLIAMWMLQ